ncbi:Uncharacterised protein [Mycobacteroides abscessus subsp. abscessus]|nr:Uncharacterised protein [Mycobacteroides abscessus subsp. abscessus]
MICAIDPSGSQSGARSAISMSLARCATARCRSAASVKCR